jgi:K+-sensing histidine kinase KdpD
LPDGAVLVAVDASDASGPVIWTAARVARSRAAEVHVVHVRETRTVADDAADLEDRAAARAVVDTALDAVHAAGVAARGEVLHVTGHHEAAADAILALADRTEPSAIVVGRPGAHGGELGARSLTAVLTERAPCDVVVVAAARRPDPVAA